MAVRRSDIVSQGRRTAEQRWEQEVRYRMSRAMENLGQIREMARRPSRVWTDQQVVEITSAIEDVVQEIRDAYQEPTEASEFQFSSTEQSQAQV